MLYVQAELAGSGFWPRVARRYIAALAVAGLDFRVVNRQVDPRNPVVVDPMFFPKEYGGVFERTSGGVFGKCDALLYIGDLMGALRFISDVENRPERCVAITAPTAGIIPPYFSQALKRFLGIVTPYEASAAVFRTAGIASVESAPLAGPPWNVEAAHEGAPIFVAVGAWEGFDDLKGITQAFCAAFKPGSAEQLLLVCPDVGELPPEPRPEVLLEEDVARLKVLPTDEEWWTHLFEGAHYFVNMARPGGCEPWLYEALGCGCTQIAPQMLANYKEKQPEKPPTLRQSGETLVAALTKLGLVTEQRKQMDTPVRIALAIPHKDRGVKWLEPCIDAVLPQLGEHHFLAVVDEDSEAKVRDEVEALCRRRGIALLSCQDNDGVWNLSRARNVGARWAQQVGATHVMPLDCDIILPKGYLARIAEEATAHPWAAVVPVVHQGDLPTDWIGPQKQEKKSRMEWFWRWLRGTEELPAEWTIAAEDVPIPEDLESFDDRRQCRRATGLACVPLEAVFTLCGWDEEYLGWGDEDIDFLWRAREQLQLQPHTLEERPWAYHRPHETPNRHGRQSFFNNERCRSRMTGALKDCNPDGWGAHVVVISWPR